MTTISFLFYIFAAILFFASFRVVTSQNAVHAALFLVLAFFQASGLWLLLHAEFLAIVLIVVYVGAVMVLFLFVVMMLDITSEKIRDGFWKSFPLAATIGIVITLQIGVIVMSGYGGQSSAPSMQTVNGNEMLSNTKELGVMLYTNYLFPLEVAAALLLVGMIAAIALTMRERKDTRTSDVSSQIRVKAKDRLSIIKVVSTVAGMPPEPVKVEPTIIEKPNSQSPTQEGGKKS